MQTQPIHNFSEQETMKNKDMTSRISVCFTWFLLEKMSRGKGIGCRRNKGEPQITPFKMTEQKFKKHDKPQQLYRGNYQQKSNSNLSHWYSSLIDGLQRIMHTLGGQRN